MITELNSKYAVELSGISKKFGDNEIFNNDDFAFEKGQNYCIMGASGVGKTTLFNIIMGLVQPDSGSCVVDGRISSVFQENRLIENMSGMENVLLVKTYEKKVQRENIRKSIIADFDRLGLSGSENKKIAELSGGMQRRVAIIRACIADSDIVLMDEPFTGLDYDTKAETAKYILEKTKGKTLLVISHDKEDAYMLFADISVLTR